MLENLDGPIRTLDQPIQGSHRAPYAKMPNIGGRYGASFIEKGGKYGIQEEKNTLTFHNKK